MNYKRTKSWLKFVRRFRFHNRKYKDRLFQRVFQDKEDLLELYNAINGTDHQNPEEHFKGCFAQESKRGAPYAVNRI